MVASRCNGCGRSDLETTAFRCTWADGRVTVEHHCHHCRFTWQRQLRGLGAKLEEISEEQPSSDQSPT